MTSKTNNQKTPMRIKDMTQGNPLKLILMFAIPLFIENIFQQIYSVVDTMIVGYRLGTDAIAAIGATSALYYLIIDLAMGMNNGFSIVITRCFGAGNKKELKQAIAGMIKLNLSIAVALTVLALLFLHPLLRFISTPDSIFEQAYIYIFVLCCGILATICYNMFAAILRAVGNSRSPLFFLIISCMLNIVLDVLFVMGINGGVAGAAIATVIAQAISAILCGIYVFKNYKSILPERTEFHVDKPMLMDLFSTGFSMALMYCVVDLGSVIFQKATNNLGEFFIAAHTAARKLIVIGMLPLIATATATSTFVGQNWGAGKIDRIKSTLAKVICLEFIWFVVAGVITFLFGANLVQFTTGTTDPKIIEYAVLSMRINVVFFPVLGVLMCLRNAMQSMGRKAAPIFSSVLELILKFLSAWWLIPKYGFIGTCVTEPITWVVMMIFLVIAYAFFLRSVSSHQISTN